MLYARNAPEMQRDMEAGPSRGDIFVPKVPGSNGRLPPARTEVRPLSCFAWGAIALLNKPDEAMHRDQVEVIIANLAIIGAAALVAALLVMTS